MTETEKKQRQIGRRAQILFSTAPDWVTFYRETLGLRGIVRRSFPTPESLAEFEKTPAYARIQEMLAELRVKKPPTREQREPTRVITVRLPKSLHEALKVEAHEHQTTMNKLCISKLLRLIDNQMIPAGT